MWIAHVAREVLQRKRDAIWAKVDGIRFDQAYDALLPYIAPGLRASINEARWDSMRTEVAAQVDKWLGTAIAHARSAQETRRDPRSDADLAGR